ncbi:MAG: hypothetical protein ACE5OV_02705 [Candidatus Bathyarchaeia archaeon]
MIEPRNWPSPSKFCQRNMRKLGVKMKVRVKISQLSRAQMDFDKLYG